MIQKNDIINLVKEKKYNWHMGENDLIVFEVPVQDRIQSCNAKIKKHDQFGDMIEIFSIIGDLDKSDLEKTITTLFTLILMNNELVYAKTQLDQESDKMLIAARTIASSADEAELEAMILEVAIFADILEEKLFGTDAK